MMRNILQRLFGRLVERDSRRLNLLERIVEDLYDRLDDTEFWLETLDDELDDVDLRFVSMSEDIDEVDFWATRAIGSAGGAGFETDLLWKALDDIDSRLYDIEFEDGVYEPFWSDEDSFTTQDELVRVIDPDTEKEFDMVLDAISVDTDETLDESYPEYDALEVW